ncbi:MAG: hypothetical protein GXP54_08930 [Deltaproteobacteria bacterium]|nr:hypothetical protein [Deltaproteobacteria bacterium]
MSGREDIERPPDKDSECRDWSQRVTYSYVTGVYLAINAIRDAYLLMESPDCAHLKTQFVQGNHDWMSDLTSVSGHHRIANTGLHPVQMTQSREGVIREALMRIATHESAGGVLLASMPMAYVTGADYERLCDEVSEATGKTVIPVPGKSLSGDWMDGYAETLLAVARGLDLEGATPSPEKVAIVGYLFDRNEGDHRANVRDLRLAISALGLDPVSVWLEGQRFEDLAAVREAGLILSFPYGRKAARWIAKRTGARLIECELPFGLEATERWIRLIGSLTGREQRAEAYIDRSLAEVIPALEWVIPYLFQGRRFGYVGDPVLVKGVSQSAAMLGARLSFAVITNMSHHTAGLDLGDGVRVLEYPRLRQFSEFFQSLESERNVDLVIANNPGIGRLPVASVQLGFPSMYEHHLYPRPFLGFGGFLAFADALANAIRREEVARTSPLGRGPGMHSV